MVCLNILLSFLGGSYGASVGVSLGLFFIAVYVFIQYRSSSATSAASPEEPNKRLSALINRLISLWATQLIYLSVLTLFLVIPGIIFGVYWVFSIFVLVDKDLKGKSILDESKQIIKGNWWRVFALIVIIVVIYFLVIGVIAIIVPGSILWLISSIVDALLFIYAINVMMFAYLQLSQPVVTPEPPVETLADAPAPTV